jgi:hypothetical protein
MMRRMGGSLGSLLVQGESRGEAAALYWRQLFDRRATSEAVQTYHRTDSAGPSDRLAGEPEQPADGARLPGSTLTPLQQASSVPHGVLPYASSVSAWRSQ